MLALNASFAFSYVETDSYTGVYEYESGKYKIYSCVDSLFFRLPDWSSYWEGLNEDDNFSLGIFVIGQQSYDRQLLCSKTKGGFIYEWNQGELPYNSHQLIEFRYTKDGYGYIGDMALGFDVLGNDYIKKLGNEFSLILTYSDKNVSDTLKYEFEVETINPQISIWEDCDSLRLEVYFDGNQFYNYGYYWHINSREYYGSYVLMGKESIWDTSYVTLEVNPSGCFRRGYLVDTIFSIQQPTHLSFTEEGDIAICEGSKASMSVKMEHYDNLEWTVNGSSAYSSDLTFDFEGTTVGENYISVNAVDTFGCHRYISKTVKVLPAPHISIVGNDVLSCDKDYLILTAKPEAGNGVSQLSFEWSTGVLSNQVMLSRDEIINDDNLIICRTTASNGCMSEDTVNVRKANCDADTTISVSCLTIQDGSNGKLDLLVGECKKQKIRITPEKGWLIGSVSFNGKDVTDMLDDSIFETPEILQNSVLSIVYKKEEPSKVAAPSNSLMRILNRDGNVVISNAPLGLPVTITNLWGAVIYSGKVNSNEMIIEMIGEGVYLVNVAGEIYKIAL